MLPVGGFVLADPFETLLRQLSEEYLDAAWHRASPIAQRVLWDPDDLSWGWLHPGETKIAGITRWTPSDFIGWTSRQLEGFAADRRIAAIRAELEGETPAIRFAATWRSAKWAIEPDDYGAGLRLIEMMCLDEPSNWAPSFVLENARDMTEPWIAMAHALLANDQRALNQALAEAHALYSPLGYRIVVEGYGMYLPYLQGWLDGKIYLPSV